MQPAPLRRGLVVALALGGALVVSHPAAAATSVCLTSQPCVAVHLSDGTVDDIDADTITSEATAAVSSNAPNQVQGVQYLYSEAADTGPFVSLGLSVNAMLANLLGPTEFSAVTFTQLTRPVDGSSAVLQAGNGDLAAPSDFLGGQLPVFWVNGDAIDYVRPLRDASDNAVVDDEVETQPGGALDLYVHTGTYLTVRSHASASTVKTGSTVSFSANATPASESPTFSWTFTDGQKSSHAHGAKVSHAFPANGVYEVLVSAAGSDDSAGAADPFYVTVCHSTGGRCVAPSATPTPPAPGSTKTPSPRPTSTPTPTTSASPGSTPGTGSTGSGSGRPRGATSPGSKPAGSSPPTGSPPADGLPLIHGRVVGQGAAISTITGAVVETDAAGVAPAGRLSVGGRVAAVGGSGAAIMLLFVAGAARELQGSRRLRSVVRPR